jgi:hypothetical protein
VKKILVKLKNECANCSGTLLKVTTIKAKCWRSLLKVTLTKAKIWRSLLKATMIYANNGSFILILQGVVYFLRIIISFVFRAVPGVHY